MSRDCSSSPNPITPGMVRLKFKVAQNKANDKFARDFYQQKAQHYSIATRPRNSRRSLVFDMKSKSRIAS